MVCGLYQADAERLPRSGTLKYLIHQEPPNSAVLSVRRDRDGTHSDDRRTFIQKIAADDLTACLGHY